MADYIDREELLKEFELYGNQSPVALSFIDETKDAPSVDAVEVVRCKDCKHRKTENCSMYVECDCGSQYTWECDNDFCSYGERKCEDA